MYILYCIHYYIEGIGYKYISIQVRGMGLKKSHYILFCPVRWKKSSVRTLCKRVCEGLFLYKKWFFLTRYAKVPYYTQHEISTNPFKISINQHEISWIKYTILIIHTHRGYILHKKYAEYITYISFNYINQHYFSTNNYTILHIYYKLLHFSYIFCIKTQHFSPFLDNFYTFLY